MVVVEMYSRLKLAIAGGARVVRHRWGNPVFKLVISAILIGVVCRHVDIDLIGQRFAAQSRIWVFAAAVLILCQVFLVALRWEYILKGLGARIETYPLFLTTYISSFC